MKPEHRFAAFGGGMVIGIGAMVVAICQMNNSFWQKVCEDNNKQRSK